LRQYSDEDEERIHAQALIREWTRSGLLEASQEARLERELDVGSRRTNPFLRAVLAFFTCLIVAACVGLVMEGFSIHNDAPIAIVCAIAAVACIGLAEYLVAAFRVYRFGVEEALGVASVALAAFSAAEAISSLDLGPRWLSGAVAALAGAAGGLGLYRRFGYLYAAMAAMVCLAAVPFQPDLPAPIQRVLAAAAMALVLIIVRPKRLQHRNDYRADAYGWLQAAAAAGVYASLNLQFPFGWHGATGLFYWTTYVLTWILPCVALAFAVREKDRELLDVGIVLALATVVTNKPYLGWPRQTWDPVILGIALIAIAVGLRRWLAGGPGAERTGFTASRLLESDRAKLSLIGTASAVLPSPGAVPSRSEPADSTFRGGRSGGGGARGTF
jgi:hypothetical protein